MEVDLDLLDYLCKKGAHYIEAVVAGAQHLPRTVIGVGTFLLDHDGNIDLLTAKQRVTFEKFLKPLLFEVACRGLAGPGSCLGDGLIEGDLSLSAAGTVTVDRASIRWDLVRPGHLRRVPEVVATLRGAGSLVGFPALAFFNFAAAAPSPIR